MWSLYKRDNTFLKPIIWRGGSQDKSVNEIVEEFKKEKIPLEVKGISGNKPLLDRQKIIQYISSCGTGKSASLLHVIKELGRGIIVVPSILLQKQYYDDYGGSGNLYIDKYGGNNKGDNNISKLKIGTLIGRKNFTCRYMKDAVDRGETLVGTLVVFDKLKISCATRGLPCNRTLTKGENRIIAGCACKYFIPPPRIKKDIEEWEKKGKLEDFKKLISGSGGGSDGSGGGSDGSGSGDNSNKCEVKYYKGIDKNEYGLFVRKNVDGVCEYYKQFYNYLPEYSDVIIMNKFKWEIESNFGRKPLVDIECIDESDEFLNGLNESISISNYMVDRLFKIDEKKTKIENSNIDLINLLEDKIELMIRFRECYDNIVRVEKVKSDKSVGVKDIKGEKNVNMKNVNVDFGLCDEINLFIANLYELKREKNYDSIDESDELSEMVYKIDTIKKYIDKAVMTTSEGVRSLVIEYNIPYPDYVLNDLLGKCCNRVLFCSATTHSDYVLETLFGLKFDNVIYGRVNQPGKLNIMKPKYAMVNLTYTNWQDEEFRQYYNNLLKYIVVGLNNKGRCLVLTSAKKYVSGLVEYLKEINANLVIDFSGEEFISDSSGNGYDEKDKEIKGNNITISYRMKRGFDGKDDLCRVVVIAKYPLSDLSNGYIRSLFGRFGKNTWKILYDIADKDVIQSVCRGLRHDMDYCYFATPDEKVFNLVSRWWEEQTVIKLRS